MIIIECTITGLFDVERNIQFKLFIRNFMFPFQMSISMRLAQVLNGPLSCD
jgi:hypothetical protein